MRCVEDVLKQKGTDIRTNAVLCNSSCPYFDTFEIRGCNYLDSHPPRSLWARVYYWFSNGEDVPRGSPCTHPEVHKR